MHLKTWLLAIPVGGLFVAAVVSTPAFAGADAILLPQTRGSGIAAHNQTMFRDDRGMARMEEQMMSGDHRGMTHMYEQMESGHHGAMTHMHQQMMSGDHAAPSQ